MKRTHLIIALIIVFVMPSTNLVAATDEEERLAVARSACQDELYGFAISHLESFLKK